MVSCNAELMPRAAGKFVAINADLVEIDETSIKETAEIILPQMKSRQFDCSVYSTHELHPQPDSFQAAQWVFLIDCLNFSFWTEGDEKFQIHYNGREYTGYYALCAAILKALQNKTPVLDAQFCSNISKSQVNEIFKSSSKVDVPLLEKRVEVMREFGTVLLQRFEGDFKNVILQANKDALKLVGLIEHNFPCFRDSAFYCGSTVKFLKRAQIAVADIYACFHGKGLGEFINIDDITTFADYRIPQCLAYFGILNYKPQLVEILKNEIDNGSVYEVEIRGCTIHAVDLLVGALRKLASKNEDLYKDVTLNAIIVDYFLWEYARENKQLVCKSPFHRVRSHLY